MPGGPVVYRFGPFEFHADSRALFLQQKRVKLAASHGGILAHLLQHEGAVVAPDALIEAGWPGLAVTENALRQAIFQLRKAIGPEYIETRPHHGVVFVGPAERVVRHVEDATLEAQLEPFLALVQGRSQIDTLDLPQVREARLALEHGLHRHPDLPNAAAARAHVLIALASGLEYEASAASATRDTAVLEAGIAHAHLGCQQAARSGEAWSTLGFVLGLKGDSKAAAAAAQKAFEFEPDNYRHELRLARVTWGEEPLQAAARALAVNPGLGQAYWLRARVFIARGAFGAALDELYPGCAAQDAQPKGFAFPAIGLHLLLGMVLAARGQLDDAVAEFGKELDAVDLDAVYGKVCAANTWCAMGAVAQRQGRRDDARDAFARALAINPRHVQAMAALHGTLIPSATPAEAIAGQAIVLVRGNRHEEAAALCHSGLSLAPPGPVGWTLPVEPLLNVAAHPALWRDALALVRARAM